MNDVKEGNDVSGVKKQDIGDPVNLENLIAGNREVPLYIIGMDEVKAKLESQIQDMLRTKLSKYMQSKKSDDTNGKPPSMPSSISVSFESLRVPFELQQSLELRARELITENVPKPRTLTQASTCVYTPVYPPAGVARNFPVPAPSERWFRWSPSAEDGFDVYISRPNVYPSNQMWVGLQLGPYMWAKEIQAWHYHPNKLRGNRIFVDRPSLGVVWMPLSKADCDGGAHTIVFRKPKFLGIWTDMYYFNSEQFWSWFGGKYVAFKWIKE